MTEDDTKSRWKELSETRWFGWARDLALLAVVVVAVTAFQTRSHMASGTQAPSLDLQTFDGASAADVIVPGRPTAVYFWAPWCGVCEASSHNMGAVREAVGDDANVVSVVLSYDNPAEVAAFMERNGVTYPVLMGNETVRREFAVDAFPTLYVLDGERNVRSTAVGYTTELGIRARLLMAGF